MKTKFLTLLAIGLICAALAACKNKPKDSTGTAPATPTATPTIEVNGCAEELREEIVRLLQEQGRVVKFPLTCVATTQGGKTTINASADFGQYTAELEWGKISTDWKAVAREGAAGMLKKIEENPPPPVPPGGIKTL